MGPGACIGTGLALLALNCDSARAPSEDPATTKEGHKPEKVEPHPLGFLGRGPSGGIPRMGLSWMGLAHTMSLLGHARLMGSSGRDPPFLTSLGCVWIPWVGPRTQPCHPAGSASHRTHCWMGRRLGTASKRAARAPERPPGRPGSSARPIKPKNGTPQRGIEPRPPA